MPGERAPLTPDTTTYIQVAQDAATLAREGQPLYAKECAGCHGASGQGGDGPKLAGNDYVKSPGAVVSQILVGAIEHGMPPFADVLNDRAIAAITTYVTTTFGATPVATTPDIVARQRGGGGAGG
jgi:mono/diheme cytochrome c family protein